VALATAAERHARELEHVRLEQFLFNDHWTQVRARCGARGIRIVGDLPIFVAHDSADVWQHPELFQLNPRGRLLVKAGVPPDYFSQTGQLWGNPLYRWDVHRDTGYGWWIRRLRRSLEMADIIRIDHFRGFEAYWEIPGRARTAKPGRWVKGPGADLFDALIRALGDLPIIAEDLGVITPEVEELRDRFHLPGMRILQFAFGADPHATTFRPAAFPENCVAYTGTHDNDTTVGWFNSEPGKGSTRSAKTSPGARGDQGLLRHGRQRHSLAHARGAAAVARRNGDRAAAGPPGPGQDARMNRPGTDEGNWEWRVARGALTPDIVARVRRLTEETGRLPRPAAPPVAPA